MPSISIGDVRPTLPNRNDRGGVSESSGRKKGKQGGEEILNFFQKKDKQQHTSAEDMATERAKKVKAV